MKNYIFCLSFIVLSAVCFASAQAVVLTFDDLSGSGQLGTYGGVDFHQLWKYYDTIQANYTPASGMERIYNSDSDDVRHQDAPFSFLSPAVFAGAYVSGYDYVTVNFLMYYQGNLVATSSSLAPSMVPTFLSSGYSGTVDEVRVHSVGGDIPNYYTLDDVTYTSVQVDGTPEPATIIIWSLLGLAGTVLGWRRLKAS
jgi:hypothetical protein